MDNQKVILITGCSSGFGLLTAVRLAAQGHFVWATMRDLSKKQSLENELAKRGAQAFIRELDVTKAYTIKNVVEEIQKTHYHIDVLINNAGYSLTGFFEDLSEEEMRAQMETNFFGVQNVCREVIPLMRKRLQGKIINISSVAGRVASPCMGAYNASKWALEAFSESLYFELSLFGISVCLLEPGYYPTHIFTKNARYARNFDNAQGPYFSFNQKLRNLARQSTGKVSRDPDHVARLIENIVNKTHPRLRYVSDPLSWSRMMVQKILPPPLIAGIIGESFMQTNKIPNQRKIFVCTNNANGEKASCGDHKGEEVFRQLREIAKERKLHPNIRVAQAKCLGQCAKGVNIMVYPENVWHSDVRLEDVPQLAEKYIV